MNILFVEDEEKSYNSVCRELKGQKNTQILPRCDFSDIDKMLVIYNVDLIILDLSNGIANDTEAGDLIIRRIYSRSFLPIVIYSGYSDIYENPYKDNYFIKAVKKGTKGVSELKKAIKIFSPFIEKQKYVSQELNTNVSEIYRDTYQKMISNSKMTSQTKNPEIFTRLLKRRLAASIDKGPDNSMINAWEIYLYPCLGDKYLTGDIIRKKKSKKDDPASYKIILSPSCDLQRKRIKNVKVACFINVQSVCNKGELKENKLRSTSPEQYMFFHKLEGEFPHMVCDYKNIEVIDFDNLDKMYDRVVSIDSPFRESIIWADITINGRPGLPDRDCKTWLENIKAECYVDKS